MRVEAFSLLLLQRPDPKEGGGQLGMADLTPTTHYEIYIFVLLCNTLYYPRDGWDYLQFTGDKTDSKN